MGILHTDALGQLSLGSVFALLGISLLLYLVVSSMYYAFFHPLAKVPGPKLYAITQIPYLYYLSKGDWVFHLAKLHEQYGPAVRFTPKDVSFITAEASKKIYGHKAAGHKSFEKDFRMYRQKRPCSSIVRSDQEDHRRMRRLLAHAFSSKALRGQGDVVDHYVELFIKGLTERAQRGEEIDIVAWYNFASFDLIGHLALGQPFGCLENGKYHPWVSRVFKGLKVLSYTQICVRLGLQNWISLLSPPSLRKSYEEHMQFAEHSALARIESKDTESQDFMSYVLRHNDEKGMSQLEIIENSGVMIIAGSETTATLLSGTTYFLLKNPDKLEKLTNEIRSAFSSEEEITVAKVDQLKYMLAVFNEGFRMYPPVAVGLSRLSPAGGEFIDGYWIPENTAVSMPHWPAYYSELNFRDPKKFVPERWLDDPRYASDNRPILSPFSLGPRDCIGKNLAYTEMRLLLARMLWKFDLEAVPTEKDWYDQKIFFLWEKGGLPIKLQEVVREKV
ncbi:Isotrichodermin C-15 hydroxylase [Fusarium agapanthi]|uniref:Isotrichodermin C-15 hydroxylase n=1 Tax=Fusarium agapanthi TaxID=1803897 RepID=A0A9P5B9X1_9HYPO|nr:Isotrichodermin C-15 hydroxylase [Fusarium agapanthi]